MGSFLAPSESRACQRGFNGFGLTSVRTLGRVCPTHSALLEWPAPLEVRSSEPMHERLEEADYADDETDYAEDEKPAQIGT